LGAKETGYASSRNVGLPSWFAPAACSSATVTVPALIFFTSAWFAVVGVGTRHALPS
jgi:hypothetical protein